MHLDANSSHNKLRQKHRSEEISWKTCKTTHRSQLLGMLRQMQELWGAHSHFRGSEESRSKPDIHGKPVPEHLGGKLEGFLCEECSFEPPLN